MFDKVNLNILYYCWRWR